jgi:ABC-type polysaccharide/polyol phosphate export permease
MLLLATGIGMFVSAASLYFRDVKFIVEVFLTFGIFFTPVFYDVSMFGDKGKWLLLNPLSPIVDGFGTTIARHQSLDLHWFLYSLACALIVFLGAYVFFKHVEPGFAESI